MVYREGGSQDARTDAVRGGDLRPSNRNTFPWFFSAGVVYQGLIPGRDNDTAAFGLAYGKFSKYLSGQHYEMVLEWTYEVAIAPWLTLQPDLQYIIKPSGMSNIANALVGGMQIAINF
jgi:porin